MLKVSSHDNQNRPLYKLEVPFVGMLDQKFLKYLKKTSLIVGTLFFGWLGDRVLKKNSLAYIYLGRSIVITLFIILPPSPTLALLFGASIGLLWLATVPLTNGVVFTFMGPKYLATLGGIVFISHQIGGLFGAWSGGKIFDIYGSYDNAWWISVALGIIAFLFHIFI